METQNTLDRLFEKIKEATARMDLAELTRLSKMAQRVQGIEAQMAALHQELRQIENSLGFGSGPVPALTVPQTAFNLEDTTAAGDIVVDINWGACKINRPNARISERKVSDTLVSFMEELQAALGIEILRKLTAFRVSRGPLVSQNPQADYVNSKTGAIYVNHPIGHTGFYVLTHSGTPEKVAALKDAWKFLGLTPGALTVHRT
jgi:hypothetical protein